MKQPFKRVLRLIYPTLLSDIGIDMEHDGETKLGITGYCQTDFYRCGISAGWSVLEYLNPDADFDEFHNSCKPCPIIGTQTKNMIKALKDQGVIVKRERLTFHAIKQAIKRKHPILTTIHIRDDEYHWIAIYGFKEHPKTVFFVGRVFPGFSKKEMNWSDMKKKRGPWLSLVARRRLKGRTGPGSTHGPRGDYGCGFGIPTSDPVIHLIGPPHIYLSRRRKKS